MASPVRIGIFFNFFFTPPALSSMAAMFFFQVITVFFPFFFISIRPSVGPSVRKRSYHFPLADTGRFITQQLPARGGGWLSRVSS